MITPSRRHFLQATAATLTAWFLPRSLFARKSDRSWWFIHADSCTSWPVADPVQWSLQNAHEPVLERASEGLAKLTPDDSDRIIRLVLRRCRLNLLELHPEQVVVHHWASHGSSRGGAVAMNIDCGGAKLVLLCPAWKKYGTARTMKADTVILHSRADDVVPFTDSEELAKNSGATLIEVGNDHRLADPESLAAMLKACEGAYL